MYSATDTTDVRSSRIRCEKSSACQVLIGLCSEGRILTGENDFNRMIPSLSWEQDTGQLIFKSNTNTSHFISQLRSMKIIFHFHLFVYMTVVHLNNVYSIKSTTNEDKSSSLLKSMCLCRRLKRAIPPFQQSYRSNSSASKRFGTTHRIIWVVRVESGGRLISLFTGLVMT